MISLNTVKDFLSKSVQDIFQNLVTNLGLNFVAVFSKNDESLIALYAVQNIIVPDEQNRKTFLIKGKLINDLGSIIQQGGAVISSGWNNDIKAIIDSLPISIHTYSDNMFGFIGLGIQGY